jgi:hypothetical protein
MFSAEPTPIPTTTAIIRVAIPIRFSFVLTHRA